jgi:hypothetical protein
VQWCIKISLALIHFINLITVVVEWLALFLTSAYRVQISVRRLSILTGFSSFPSVLEANTGIVACLKLGHYCFLPYALKFIIYLSRIHSALYSLSYWKLSLNKLKKSKSIEIVLKIHIPRRSCKWLRFRRMVMVGNKFTAHLYCYGSQ